MSSIGGSGVGGNTGGPLVPTQRDIETTAWTQVNKQALGIVPDSIEKSFHDLSPRYTFGYLGGFGYRSTAGNPLLDHPLESIRYTRPSPAEVSDGWRTSYEHLTQQLPPEIAARLLKERNLPFENRNLSFVALDNVLVSASKVLTQAQSLGGSQELGALEEMRTTLNIMLPFAALKGSISTGSEVLTEAHQFLSDQGPNYRYFDGFNNLSSQLNKAIGLMQRVDGSLGETVNGQLPLSAMQDAAKAATVLGSISSQLEKISLGDDLQMLLPTVRAMESVATSLALPNTTSAPLFLALSWGSLGLFHSDSPLGTLGIPFETLMNAISQGTVAGIMPANNKAGNELLTMMLTLSATTWIGLASLAVDTGLGLYPSKSAQEVEAARFFAFETALHFVTNSNILETFYKEAIAISGGNPEAQNEGSVLLAQFSHLTIMLAGALAGKQSALRLIENEADALQQGAQVAENIEARRESEQTTDAAISIKLLSLALQSHDYEGFSDAYGNFLNGLGVSQEDLNKDLTLISKAGQNVAGLSNAGPMDPHLTTMINVM
jgi:hypothetical protein